jgi:hypothetical protein
MAYFTDAGETYKTRKEFIEVMRTRYKTFPEVQRLIEIIGELTVIGNVREVTVTKFENTMECSKFLENDPATNAPPPTWSALGDGEHSFGNDKTLGRVWPGDAESEFNKHIALKSLGMGKLQRLGVFDTLEEAKAAVEKAVAP